MTVKEISYTDNKSFEEKIRKKHYIPYRISSSDEKYEFGKRYYNAYWKASFKVLSVKYDKYGVLLENYIRWDDGNYGLICTDLDINADLRLEVDRTKIYESEIINTECSYTGAEIIYWFFINRINCFNKKYKGFWKFIDNLSDYRLSDESRYKLYGDIDTRGYYTNCKIVKIK